MNGLVKARDRVSVSGVHPGFIDFTPPDKKSRTAESEQCKGFGSVATFAASGKTIRTHASVSPGTFSGHGAEQALQHSFSDVRAKNNRQFRKYRSLVSDLMKHI